MMNKFELEEDKSPSSGDKNAAKFECWLNSKIPLDDKGKKIYLSKTWMSLINPKTHNLARSEVAVQSDIGLSALRQNPKIKALLEELEGDLRKAGILPELTNSGQEAKDATKKYDQSASLRRIDAIRLRELEEENQRLRAELRRFEELKEIIGEMGLEL